MLKALKALALVLPVVLLGSIFSGVGPSAQASTPSLFASSEGREFFLTFDANLLGFEDDVRTNYGLGVPFFAEQWLYVSGDPGTSLEVHFPPIDPSTGMGSHVQNVTIGSSGVEAINASERLVTKVLSGATSTSGGTPLARISSISQSYVNGLPAVAFSSMTDPGRSVTDGVSANAIRVQVTTENKSVAVYGAHLQRLTSDAFSAVPSQSLGTRYRAVAWNHLEFSGAERPSRISIIATEPGTTSVTITPPSGHSGLRNSQNPGSPRTSSYAVTLTRGQVYSVTPEVSVAGLQDDVTGTLVESDKKVVVTSGNECAQVGSFGSCDHLIQYMPPVTAWGTSYILASSINSNLKDVFRVVADTDGTTLTLNGAPVLSGGTPVQLDSGEYFQFEASSVRAFDVLETNHPVMVAKFIAGGHPATYFWGYTGDPALSIMTPTLQFLDSYKVSTPSSGFSAHSINVVVPTANLGSLVLSDLDTNRALVRSTASPGTNGQTGSIAGTTYSFVRFDVPAGAYRISADEGIGVYVEGFNNYDSYSYVGGMAFVNLQENPAGALEAQREAAATPPSSDGGGSTGAAATIQTPAQTVIPRPRPRPTVDPTIQQGPILRNTGSSQPPAAPLATLGGRPAAISTQVTSPTGFSLTTGVLNLGLQVQQDQGAVRQNNSGGTEIEVRKGATASMTGTGLLPRSTVQVFLPLQGANAKEIARIPVDESGTFTGEAVFATRTNERPLPIGRQLLQIVSLDEDGNQAVVEMAVNIAQPLPEPELDRSVGATPRLRPGQFLATNAGEPEIVTVIPLPDAGQALVEGEGWQMAVDIPSARGAVTESEDGGALLQLVRDEIAEVSGSGFMPGTRADVWLFSEPTLLGTVAIDDNGEFKGEIGIDANAVAPGEHTLQIQGVGEDGYVRAANLGVLVSDAVEEVTTEEAVSGLLWWLVAVALLLLAVALAYARWRRKRS